MSEKKKWYQKKWLIALLVIGGLIVIGSIMSSPDSAKGKEEADTTVTKKGEASEQEDKTYKIGDTVKVGKTEWKITEVKDLGGTLKSDNEFTENAKTDGKFIRVKLYIKNLADDPQSISGFAMLDANDKKYDPYTDSVMYIPEKEQMFFEQLNPDIGKNMQEIFEVPKEAKGLKIRLYDLADSLSDNIAYVKTGIK